MGAGADGRGGPPVATGRPGLEQRKLATVLFADLVDFTVLSQQLDVEDVHAVVDGYFGRWRRIIEDHGGVVEKFIGDAVMAVFGLVRSFEDDAHRAVRAAVAMRAAMSEVNATVAAPLGIELAMRIGIDTGEVVASRLGGRDDDFVVVGEIVNRASRLQGQAPTGGVLVSADTFRLVRGAFHLRPVGGLELKGYQQRVEGYLVEDERPRAVRHDVGRGVEGVETRTVGRVVELTQLRERFEDVVDERSWQVVTVVGEAGVGKSRLLQELAGALDDLDQPVWWFAGAASPERNGPFTLLHDMFATRFDITDTDGPAVVRAKWEEGIGRARAGDEGPMDVAGDAALIGRWLGFELGDGDDDVDPRTLHALAVAALARYFRRLATMAPVVVALEDLHWADEASLGLIDAAAPTMSGVPVLVVATARPTLFERHPHWGEGLAHHLRLDLGSLSRRETRELVREILRPVPQLPERLVDLVLDAAEGNPFYVEELVARLIETGVVTTGDDGWTVSEERLAETEVPATLRSVLQARLDDLAQGDRDVLQRAAVIGRVFWDEAVVALDDAGGDTVAPLARLRAREVVYQRERSTFDGAGEYRFKHALLRDVAYDSVLRRRRQDHHRRAAAWYETVAARAGRGDELAGVVAGHLERAGDPVGAARWLLRAGGRAIAVHGLADARAQLSHGLVLAGGADAELRVDLLLTYEEALDRLGDRPAQAAALEELAVLDVVDPGRRVRRLLAQCRWSFHHSDYDRAAEQARTAIALAAAGDLPAAGTEAELWLGKALAWVGQHDEARTALGRARRDGEARGSTRVRTEALRYLAIVATNRSEFATAEALMEEAIALHRAAGDIDGESLERVQLASVLYNAGRFGEARHQLEAAMPAIVASGIRYREAVVVSNLASIVLQHGEYGLARRLIERGLTLSRELEDAEGTATALNIQGELDRRTGAWAAARQRLTESLEAAPPAGHEVVTSDSLASLAVSALHAGDVAGAVEAAVRSVDEAERSASGLARARALVARAYVRVATGALADALADAERARTDATELGIDYLVAEGDALLARAALVQDDLGAAGAAAERVWPHLGDEHLMGALQTGEIFLAVRDVFAATGDERAPLAAEHGRRFLATIAERIDEPELRDGFLIAVPSHRALAQS